MEPNENTREKGGDRAFRDRLVSTLQGATESANYCADVLAKPYSNATEWAQKLEGARGYQRGIARAIELLDEMEARS